MTKKEIFVGFTKEEKKEAIKSYLAENTAVEHIVYFRPKFMPEMCTIPGVDMSIESYTWEEAIKYKVFYPLLDKIDSTYLIIMDEMMRTQKRYQRDKSESMLHRDGKGISGGLHHGT